MLVAVGFAIAGLFLVIWIGWNLKLAFAGVACVNWVRSHKRRPHKLRCIADRAGNGVRRGRGKGADKEGAYVEEGGGESEGGGGGGNLVQKSKNRLEKLAVAEKEACKEALRNPAHCAMLNAHASSVVGVRGIFCDSRVAVAPESTGKMYRCVYMCVCLCGCVCAYVYTYIYIYIHICMHVYIDVYICIHLCVCVYAQAHVSVCVCKCMHRHTCTYVCVCVGACTQV